MSRGTHVVCWALALLAAASPLPFGSVDPLPAAALQLCVLGLAFGWMTLRVSSGATPLPWRDPLLVGGAALMAYGIFQMTPLPPALLGALSPGALAARTAYALDPGAWAPLSLHPWGTWRSCVHVACWTLAATMVRHCAVDLKGRLVVAGGLLAGGLFQAGYGLFEFISGRQHIFGYRKEHFTDVATGTFISRNNYAGYLEMAIPIGLAVGLLALSKGPASGRDASLKRRLALSTGQESFRALALLMGVFLMAMALLMSRSRMGIIATALALLVGGLALGLKGRSRRYALASVGVAAVAALFATQIDILPVVGRFEALRNEFGTGYGRLAVWKEALPMLASYPLTGSGLGTWEMAFSPFRTEGTQVRVDFAHNDYLEFAAEAGLFGMVVLAGAVFFSLRRLRGQTEPAARVGHDEIALGAGAGLVALALHSFTDFHMSIPADALAASTLAGLFLRPNGPTPLAAARAISPSVPRFRAAWAAGAIVLAALALSVGSPALAEIRSDAAGARAEDDRSSADPDAVLAATEPASPAAPALAPDADLCAACRLDPFNAARWIDAAGRARDRLLRDVEVIVRAEAAGELPDPATRLYLARRIDRALALARRGLALAPASGRGHLEAGLLLFGRFALAGLPPEASEDFDAALKEFERAMRLQPWRAATHRRVARLLAPLWDACDETQRRFIAKATRRAREIDPWAADLKEAAARMGV